MKERQVLMPLDCNDSPLVCEGDSRLLGLAYVCGLYRGRLYLRFRFRRIIVLAFFLTALLLVGVYVVCETYTRSMSEEPVLLDSSRYFQDLSGQVYGRGYDSASVVISGVGRNRYPV